MVYVCPMHPEVRSDKPGRCSKCGMKLVLQKDAKPTVKQVPLPKTNYDRLAIIIGLIALATLVLSLKDAANGSFNLRSSLTYFMAGFFLVFSGFKLMDLQGFAQGYSTYDLLASRVFEYGYVYPFIELAFGLAYLTSFQLHTISLAVLVIMVFSGVGVARKMLEKEEIYCACLGTIIKVPLGEVTLVEDFGMAAMALLMLLNIV